MKKFMLRITEQGNKTIAVKEKHDKTLEPVFANFKQIAKNHNSTEYQ